MYKKTKKTIARAGVTLTAMLFLSAFLSGCGTEKTTETDDKKTIVIGCDKFEPYSYQDTNGEVLGIDVELAKEAFSRLGYEAQVKFISWEKKDEDLKDGSVDCVWSCYTMTGREDKYQWAGPYMYSRQVVVVRKDSDINNLSDLEGKRVGVQSTTYGEKVFLDPESYGLPSVDRLVSVSGTDELFAILRKDYVDAIAGHEALMGQLAGNDQEEYRILDESPYMSQLGVAFEKGSHEDLAKELTETLEEMKEDGSMEEIVEKYGLDPEKTVWGGQDHEE